MFFVIVSTELQKFRPEINSSDVDSSKYRDGESAESSLDYRNFAGFCPVSIPGRRISVTNVRSRRSSVG
jgi:hypothetical protein